MSDDFKEPMPVSPVQPVALWLDDRFLEKAKQLLKVQADFGGFYNANGAKPILAEVSREHGQTGVGGLIRELELGRIFGFKPGTVFDGSLSAGER